MAERRVHLNRIDALLIRCRDAVLVLTAAARRESPSRWGDP